MKRTAEGAATRPMPPVNSSELQLVPLISFPGIAETAAVTGGRATRPGDERGTVTGGEG